MLLLYLLLTFGLALGPVSASSCLGIVFIAEQRASLCTQFKNFQIFARNVATSYFDSNTSFAIRGYGDKSPTFQWIPLQWYSKDNFIATVDSWHNEKCTPSTNIYFAPPLSDANDFLRKLPMPNVGIIFGGSLDTVSDASNASSIGSQLASLNYPLFVWDYSQSANSQTLFKTLVNGRTDRIFKFPSGSVADITSNLAPAISYFQTFGCGSPPTTVVATLPSTMGTRYTTSPATYTQTTNTNYQTSTGTTVSSPTNNSTLNCVKLELIFILDRSQSMVPSIYNSNVTAFVKQFASQFTFPDEANGVNPGFVRLGVIQFSDSPDISIPLGNYSRSTFASLVNQRVNINDDSGLNNVKDALLAAYNQFKLSSTTSNRAVILILDDVSITGMNDAVDAMNQLKTLVTIPMGAIVPGFSGTPEEGFAHLKMLLGNDSRLAFPDLQTASAQAPALISSTYPCVVPPACSALIFLAETTVAIGPAKLQYLQMVQKLVNNVQFNKNQRFGLGMFGVEVYKDIELMTFDAFNATLSAFILTVSSDNSPNGGKTYLAPILTQLLASFNSGLYKSYSVLLLSETESVRDPTAAYAAAVKVAAMNQDVYVIDQSKFTVPSNLFPTLTSNLPGHVLNGTTGPMDALITPLTASLINKFNSYKC